MESCDCSKDLATLSYFRLFGSDRPVVALCQQTTMVNVRAEAGVFTSCLVNGLQYLEVGEWGSIVSSDRLSVHGRPFSDSSGLS